MVNHQQRAEELTQDVFLQAGKSLYRFVPKADHKTWLYRIATNICINDLKKSSNKYEQLLADCQEELFPTNLEQDNELNTSHHMIEIKDFMNKQLNFKDQSIFVYKYLDRMTHDEIAIIMNCTKRTVINRTQQIATKFKEWYDEN